MNLNRNKFLQIFYLYFIVLDHLKKSFVYLSDLVYSVYYMGSSQRNFSNVFYHS